MHTCPAATPSPHIGGRITGIGCLTVLIGGMPAATAGDVCTCTGPPDVITSGSTGVLIGGKPAARLGDKTMHGGVIVDGCASVLIGETKKRIFYRKPDIYENDEDWPTPSREEKQAAINQAIQDAIRLLENKLVLLENNDPEMLKQFKKWFGSDDSASKEIIIQRIRMMLKVINGFTDSNFQMLQDDRDRIQLYAKVYSKDESFTIHIGYPFWKAGTKGRTSMEGVLIHELSHFDCIGKTKDHAYAERCLTLVTRDPEKALYNADSFQFFIEGYSLE